MSAVTAILLAAGASRRFGSAKLLHPLAGGEAIGVASAKNLQQVFSEIVAVVHPDDRALQQAYTALGVEVVLNPRADTGLASSIAVGVGARPASPHGWLVALADMPVVQTDTLGRLNSALQQGHSLVAPLYRGQRGNPVGFAPQWREALLQLQQDKGARDLLLQHAAELTLLDCDDPGVVLDIDSPADLAAINAMTVQARPKTPGP